jgi:hypothetical protein
MNWDQMKKNLHARVQLIPTAHRLDEHGRKLPAIDDDWLIEEVTADGVRIKNVRTHHTTTLGRDHIYDWRSNPDRSQAGVKYGFLVLKVQISLKPKGLSITPNVFYPDRAKKIVSYLPHPVSWPSARRILPTHCL